MNLSIWGLILLPSGPCDIGWSLDWSDSVELGLNPDRGAYMWWIGMVHWITLDTGTKKLMGWDECSREYKYRKKKEHTNNTISYTISTGISRPRDGVECWKWASGSGHYHPKSYHLRLYHLSWGHLRWQVCESMWEQTCSFSCLTPTLSTTETVCLVQTFTGYGPSIHASILIMYVTKKY